MATQMASIAQSISSAIGGPFFAATINSPGAPVFDAGGSIITPGTPLTRTCKAQVDSVTQDMRAQDGFAERDMRILVLSDTLAGSISLDDTISVLAGPHAGEWMVQSINRDPFGVYHELRGRKA